MALIPRLPHPVEIVRATVQVAGTAVSVPGRLLALLTAAEELVARANQAVTDTEDAVAHARRVIVAAETQATAIDPVLAFAREFSEHEVHAAIKLVDELPRLARHLNEDVLPILTTLGQIGPDMHELLEVANDMRQAILGIPGFDYLRRRGEDKDEAKDEAQE
ncbi:hypothetical protein [Actinophytocola gossypii]|uniref:Ribulose 1,5-bisphosphate carboxylase large subunit n=1 Tax=Actinophytocola gossypii TaxID=2812003 RepID=A0ABT2J2B8_9PSEU|nr:hypothetical protein [Actinophytocola gossypii]MCT2581911.1 hypothetical protein [Actinophytocola gossypii]